MVSQCFVFTFFSGEGIVVFFGDKIPISCVFDFPVDSCRKSWYSLVSQIRSLWDEYMFMVAKKDIGSSKSPKLLPPLTASNSPNLSHVQCDNTMGLGFRCQELVECRFTSP